MLGHTAGLWNESPQQEPRVLCCGRPRPEPRFGSEGSPALPERSAPAWRLSLLALMGIECPWPSGRRGRRSIAQRGPSLLATHGLECRITIPFYAPPPEPLLPHGAFTLGPPGIECLHPSMLTHGHSLLALWASSVLSQSPCASTLGPLGPRLYSIWPAWPCPTSSSRSTLALTGNSLVRCRLNFGHRLPLGIAHLDIHRAPFDPTLNEPTRGSSSVIASRREFPIPDISCAPPATMHHDSTRLRWGRLGCINGLRGRGPTPTRWRCRRRRADTRRDRGRRQRGTDHSQRRVRLAAAAVNLTSNYSGGIPRPWRRGLAPHGAPYA